MRSKLIVAAGALVLLAAAPASAEEYSGADLLSPCVEADNDARWGETAELECEQYINGFVAALAVMGNKESCPPKVNTPDEVRWAYMRWIHEDYKRRKQGAGTALMAALKDKFPCKQ